MFKAMLTVALVQASELPTEGRKLHSSGAVGHSHYHEHGVDSGYGSSYYDATIAARSVYAADPLISGHGLYAGNLVFSDPLYDGYAYGGYGGYGYGSSLYGASYGASPYYGSSYYGGCGYWGC